MKSQQKSFLKVISTKLFRFSNVNVDSVYTHYIYKYSIYLYFSSQSVDSIKLSSVPCVFTKTKNDKCDYSDKKIELSSLNFLRNLISQILLLILPKKHNYGDHRWIMLVNHRRNLNSVTSIPTQKFSIKYFLKALFSVTDIKRILSFWRQVWILIWCYSKHLYFYQWFGVVSMCMRCVLWFF